MVYLCFEMPHGSSYVGGIAAILNSYLKNKDQFKKRGYDISLFDYQNNDIGKISFSPLRNFVYGLGQYVALKKHMTKDGQDIVHIHTSRSFHYLKDVMFGSLIAKKYRSKIVLSIHVGEIKTVNRYLAKPIQKLAINGINKYFSQVVFLSHKIKNQFILAGLDREKCKVLYNFHDLPPLDVNVTKLEQNCGKLRCIFMGMLNRDKGILDLMSALSECLEKDVHLDICGNITDETIREALEERKRKISTCATLWGYVQGSQKRDLLERADVLILPSYHEGLPLVVLEALASGCALIVTPVGALPELLTEKNAIWVQPGDIKGLEKAIKTLQDDEQLLKSMKSANREKGDFFTLYSHINQLCEIYDKL